MFFRQDKQTSCSIRRLGNFIAESSRYLAVQKPTTLTSAQDITEAQTAGLAVGSRLLVHVEVLAKGLAVGTRLLGHVEVLAKSWHFFVKVLAVALFAAESARFARYGG